MLNNCERVYVSTSTIAAFSVDWAKASLEKKGFSYGGLLF